MYLKMTSSASASVTTEQNYPASLTKKKIIEKSSGMQILHTGKRHAPVLFPNVGRLYNDTSLINGKSYTSGQHGFARDMDFICTEETETSINPM